MGKELYNRVHPDIMARVPEFGWFLSEGYITRENVAQHRDEAKTAAIKDLEEAAKTDPLFKQVSVREDWIDSLEEGVKIKVFIMTPVGASGPLPGHLGIHGGGMIVGSCESEQLQYMEFALKVGCVVISPDYRLSPEYPYPAGMDDCYAAALWMEKNAERLGIDPERLSVGGTSAGGNLAMAMSLRARDEKGPKFIAQFIGSPMLDYRNNTPSAIEMDEETFPWSYKQNEYGWEMYLNGLDPVPAYASPAMAEELAGLPPTVIYSNELDPFRDETMLFSMRLMQAGVPTDFHIFPGCFHGADLVGKGTAFGDRLFEMEYTDMRNLLYEGKF